LPIRGRTLPPQKSDDRQQGGGKEGLLVKKKRKRQLYFGEERNQGFSEIPMVQNISKNKR